MLFDVKLLLLFFFFHYLGILIIFRFLKLLFGWDIFLRCREEIARRGGVHQNRKEDDIEMIENGH